MSSTYGEYLKLSIFGQSHGSAIGMTLDNIPAGLPVDMDTLAQFLARRAPGSNPWSTPRQESDTPEILSGIVDGYTCGAPIAAIIRNTNTRSGDYAGLKDCPRPGHADYTAQMKYSGYQDAAGGGHFSGRLTAALCIAGGLCKQWLAAQGICIAAHISEIAGIQDDLFDPVCPETHKIWAIFPVLNSERGQQMQEKIAAARSQGDSVGGIIECAVTGLPAGLGGGMFGGMESRIASIVYGVPAVRAVEFGAGMGAARLTGSQNNDAYTFDNGQVKTMTNHSGGILGGITSGMPLIFRCGIKPTPSIAKCQQSVSLSGMEIRPLQIQGRHDPCIVPRAVPVIEAAAAIAIFDAYLAK